MSDKKPILTSEALHAYLMTSSPSNLIDIYKVLNHFNCTKDEVEKCFNELSEKKLLDGMLIRDK